VELTGKQRDDDKRSQMKRDIERLPEKTALYFALVKGLITLTNGEATDNGFDDRDKQTIFTEIENAIDLLRRNWGEI
jgi:hypothetical protein